MPKTPEKIPFDVNDFANMYDTEFIIALFPDWLKGSKRLSGLLGEIINRKPKKCEYYGLASIGKVLELNNCPFSTEKYNEEMYYIFNMTQFNKPKCKIPFILKNKASLDGELRPYSLRTNKITNSNRTAVNIELLEISEGYKTKGVFISKSLEENINSLLPGLDNE